MENKVFVPVAVKDRLPETPAPVSVVNLHETGDLTPMRAWFKDGTFGYTYRSRSGDYVTEDITEHVTHWLELQDLCPSDDAIQAEVNRLRKKGHSAASVLCGINFVLNKIKGK